MTAAERSHGGGTGGGHVQGDLFALLAEQQTGQPEITHVLMPNMGLACGRDTLAILQAPHHGRAITTIPDRATCPDCLSVPDLPGRIHARQRRQA